MSEEDQDNNQRPLWQELLVLAIPILLTEGILLLRDHLRRMDKKKKRKREGDEVPTPLA